MADPFLPARPMREQRVPLIPPSVGQGGHGGPTWSELSWLGPHSPGLESCIPQHEGHSFPPNRQAPASPRRAPRCRLLDLPPQGASPRSSVGLAWCGGQALPVPGVGGRWVPISNTSTKLGDLRAAPFCQSYWDCEQQSSGQRGAVSRVGAGRLMGHSSRAAVATTVSSGPTRSPPNI